MAGVKRPLIVFPKKEFRIPKEPGTFVKKRKPERLSKTDLGNTPLRPSALVDTEIVRQAGVREIDGKYWRISGLEGSHLLGNYRTCYGAYKAIRKDDEKKTGKSDVKVVTDVTFYVTSKIGLTIVNRLVMMKAEGQLE